MNIVLLFGLFPKEKKAEIIENSIGVIQNAADSLQWSVVNGLTHYYDDINLINLPYIGSFPRLYTKNKESNYLFSIYDNPTFPKAKNIGFNNYFGIRIISRYLNAKKALSEWERKVQADKIIIIYSINIPFLRAATKIKNNNNNIKICVIVPDIPAYKWDSESKFMTSISKLQNRLLEKLYPFVDKFVFLTKHMKDFFPIEDKSYTVIEGIYNYEFENKTIHKENKKNGVKTVFYGGTLARRYGILNLVFAFNKLKNKNYRLIICGDGTTRNEILDISKNDERIIYKGQLPREDVLKLMLESDLLVNPRTPEGEYTKYSFPSKTIEYLGSGVPTLLYKLEGIPEEYYNYCFSIENTSIEALSNKIAAILSMPKEDLITKGEEAKKFIKSEKNPVKQCEKLVRLIEDN